MRHRCMMIKKFKAVNSIAIEKSRSNLVTEHYPVKNHYTIAKAIPVDSIFRWLAL